MPRKLHNHTSPIVLKDKSDLVGVGKFISNAYILGAMEKPNLPVEDIKVISTKFSKVGKTTLDKYPNLEWVVYRGHGTDSINLELCSKYGVGVVTTNPNIEGCAHWIKDKMVDFGMSVIFGNGSISKRLQELIADYRVIDSKTSKEVIHQYLHSNNLTNVIATVPLSEHTKKMFNKALFNDTYYSRFISISRAKCHDNKDLLELINNKNIGEAHIDTLGTELRDELLNTNKVFWYNHLSWDFLGHKNDHKQLSKVIESCLNNNVENPVLQRRANQWF